MHDLAPCGICDHPADDHGTRYTAGWGHHEWTEPALTITPLPEWRISELTDTK